tara:strand:+ start:1703 stop:2560 length:858 start_codon:yes stop_codon:yes gene_type:complete
VKILVIIPVFNEEKNLEKCIDSFVNQTHKLSQITIVDDGSIDNTPLIGQKLEKSHGNIKFLRKRGAKSIASPGKKIIQAFNYGLNKSSKNFDLIGKFDGDIELPKNYFQKMVKFFMNNEKLGMCGGVLAVKKDGIKIENMYNKTHLRGPIKLYRKSSFFKIGGLVESMGWDTLDELKMLYYDYEIKIDHKLIGFHLRETGERYKNTKFIKQGRVMNLLGYDTILLIIGSLKFSFVNKSISPFFYSIYGYYNSLFKKEKKLVNNKLSKFVRSYRYQQILEKIGINN